MRFWAPFCAALFAACVPGPVDTGAAPGEGCSRSAQCPNGFYCVEGACQLIPPSSCASDRDCAGGMKCASGRCVSGDPGPDDAGVADDAGTAAPPDAGGGGGGAPDAGPAAGVANGDFEGGALAGWTVTGQASAFGGGHTGAFAAQVGSTQASHDSSIAQAVLVPSGSAQLGFWYKSVCQDIVDYDWGVVTILDPGGALLATALDRTCANTNTWVHVTTDLSKWAGQTVVLSFDNHDDGYSGDPTYTLYDDIQVGTSAPDFSISAAPAAVSGAGATTVSTAALDGFAGSIVLTVSGAPSGASASLSATSVSPGNGATLTLSPGTAAGGAYRLTVTGTSGPLSHSASLSWTIAAQACTTDTWSSWAHGFFGNNCVGCHSQFDSYSGVSSDRSGIQSRISSGNMPQGSTLSPADKQRILKWLSCGLPQ